MRVGALSDIIGNGSGSCGTNGLLGPWPMRPRFDFRGLPLLLLLLFCRAR